MMRILMSEDKLFLVIEASILDAVDTSPISHPKLGR